jgi:hypothetical protein
LSNILLLSIPDLEVKYVVSMKMNYEVFENKFMILFVQVKDQKEYEFDPASIVMDICKIYVHLHESDSFCLAVSQDGRSYSPHLFTFAQDVLGKLYAFVSLRLLNVLIWLALQLSVQDVPDMNLSLRFFLQLLVQ